MCSWIQVSIANGIATGLVKEVNRSLAGRGASCCTTKTLARNEHLLHLYRSLCQEVKVVGRYTDKLRKYAYIQWTV
jgi:hypothetical protein